MKGNEEQKPLSLGLSVWVDLKDEETISDKGLYNYQTGWVRNSIEKNRFANWSVDMTKSFCKSLPAWKGISVRKIICTVLGCVSPAQPL